MQPPYEVVGQAVLRDYPLRLWAREQERSEDLVREFTLMLIGQERSEHPVPAQLLGLAEMFATRFGPLLDDLTRSRREALDAGRDRMDSVVPLVAGTADLLDQVRGVLAEVDTYCREAALLALERTPEQIALFDWTHAELLAQLAGEQPTPWPGPFL